jgi:hypothetical protein
MDGTGEHHSGRGLPGSEDQKSYVLPHMWTLDLGQIQHDKGRAHQEVWG